MIELSMLKIHPRLKEYYYPAEYIKIDDNMYFARGGGSNAVVLTSKDKENIIIIDTKSIRAKKLRQFVKSINPNAELTIILTHYHNDHIAGTKKYNEAYIITGNYTDKDWKKHTNLPLPNERIKINETKTIPIDDEILYIENLGAGHTRNDLIVYLEKRQILITGDVLYVEFHPVINKKYGADINHWIENIDYLNEKFDYKSIIPGHGGLSKQENLIEMKEYLQGLLLAAEDEDHIFEMEEKYKKYLTVPFFIGLKRNVKFTRNSLKIKNELEK